MVRFLRFESLLMRASLKHFCCSSVVASIVLCSSRLGGTSSTNAAQRIWLGGNLPPNQIQGLQASNSAAPLGQGSKSAHLAAANRNEMAAQEAGEHCVLTGIH